MNPVRSFVCLVLATVLGGCASTPVSNPKVLRIGFSPNLPPIAYEANGQPTGLEADFARQLAAELGREPQFVTMGFERLMPALEKGKIDIIMTGMSITRLRTLNVRFCDPYLRIGQMALIRSKDRAMYRNTASMPYVAKSVAVIRGSTGEAVVRKAFTRSKIVALGDVRDAADDLAKGKVDLIIADAPLIVQMAADHETRGLELVPHLLNREELAWAVSRDNPALQEQANAALRNWKAEGTLDKSVRRWLPYADRYDLSPVAGD